MIDNLSVARLKGICLQQKAISDARGMSLINYGVGYGIHSPQAKVKEAVNVTVVPLDDYYEDFGKDRLVVAIKLDIEGNGARALRGAPKMVAAAQNIFVGIHNADEKQECHNLKSAGFNILDESKFPNGVTPNGLCVATRNLAGF